MDDFIKKREGITLIALVITIIVLLILAGIAIAMLSGENGILKQLAKAKENTKNAATLENIKLAMTAATTNKDHKVNKTNLETELERYFETVEVYEYKDETFIIMVDGKRYKVESNGKIDERSYILEKVSSEENDLTLVNSDGGNLYDYKIYGNSIQSYLPEEYQQVKFIESTGTQCIDTEYIPKTNTKVECELSFEGNFNNKTNRNILGTSNEENIFTVNFGAGTTEGNILFTWVDKIYENGATAYSINITDEIRTNKNLLTVQSGKVSYGNISRTIATKTEDQTESLILFGKRNISGISAFNAYNMRVYSFKIYEDSNLIRNMIPCYRKSDGKVGMYDIVEGKFYTNLYTDEFVKSEDISLSVGDTVIEGEYKGKYKIPITVNGKNLFNISTAKNTQTTGSVLSRDDTSMIIQMNSSASNVSPGSTNWSSGWVSFNYKLEPGKTYTFSYNVEFLELLSENIKFPINHGIIDQSGNSFKTINISELNKVYTNNITKTTDSSGIYSMLFSCNSSKIKILNMQLEEGNTVTEYEPYKKPQIYNIYLDEPLRKVGDYADYIDFRNKKVVRKVNSNYEILGKPIEESIELPNIPTNVGTHIITVDTLIKPSNIELTYYKQSDE